MSTMIDPQMAMGAAAQQDLTAQRQRMETLSRSDNPQESRARLQSACEGFEAVFIQKMWEQMRATLPKDGMMKSKEEEHWQSMYDQELGKSMASVGGIGLADMMMKQLTRQDEQIDTSMSDATKDSAMRRPHLQVSPAPLLPDSANVEKRTEREHAQTTGQAPSVNQQPALAQNAAQNAPLNANGANMGIYDGEAAFAAPAPDENAPMTQAAGQETAPVAGQNPAPANGLAVAADTPPNVRQLLDELAQQQGVPLTAETAEPQVVRHTYQTNLPPSERKADLLRNGNARNLNTQPTGKTYAPSADVVAGYSAMTPQNTPNTQAVAQAGQTAQIGQTAPIMTVAENTPAPERTDILSGIQPRFIPTRFQNRPEDLGRDALGVTMPNRSRSTTSAPGTAFASLQGASTDPFAAPHAGGPALDAPENVVSPVALGNPEPPRGSMTAPVSGELSSAFGWRLDPFTGQRSWHTGVDIKAQPGEGVRAAMDGVVTFAGTHPELGNLVVMDHGDGLRTFYGHNQSLDVSVGQRINAGTELARAGASGRAAGSHVHFEVRRGELALNPEPLLRQPHMHVAQVR